MFSGYHALFDLLVGRLCARVEDPSGQVLDEADALSDTDLLLLRQLSGKPCLAGCGMVHWHLRPLLGSREHLLTHN